ncbi:MAG: dihydrofolate reductase [Caulobacter sp.]|jgi:dihydrofolate reductase|uniref:dihydrofolate reductase n=1 Tax=Caulobacter sp. CCH9-E1 TaxID=1768768 RepID=UPI000829CDC1|nr:dihydrofolate reductase [Caulobacter sp. CCH9-E1]MCK5908603.1 dihydrofolate reductase [Caulobacter sp.]
MTQPVLAIVVARAANGVIGRDGDLPWRLKSDLALFKANTLGKPIIMGRKTWDSLPRKPLPGRMNVVLTRDQSFEPEGAIACETWMEAVQMAKEQAADDSVDEVCVIGGRALFELALPKAKRLYLTEVDAQVDGDVHFPVFDENAWTEVRREAHAAGDGDDHAFVFRVLERV